LSQLARIQRSYQTYLSGYQFFRRLGQYQKSRKNQKSLTGRKRKLDHSLSLSHCHSPLQYLEYQRYQLQFPTRRKQNDG
jgi:hypothetical protein